MSECPHVLARYLAETNNVFTYVFSLSPVRTLTHHPAVVCSAAVMSRVVGTGWWDLGPRAHQLWSEAEESEPVTKQKASLASALLTARRGRDRRGLTRVPFGWCAGGALRSDI